MNLPDTCTEHLRHTKDELEVELKLVTRSRDYWKDLALLAIRRNQMDQAS